MLCIPCWADMILVGRIRCNPALEQRLSMRVMQQHAKQFQLYPSSWMISVKINEKSSQLYIHALIVRGCSVCPTRFNIRLIDETLLDGWNRGRCSMISVASCASHETRPRKHPGAVKWRKPGVAWGGFRLLSNVKPRLKQRSNGGYVDETHLKTYTRWTIIIMSQSVIWGKWLNLDARHVLWEIVTGSGLAKHS